MSINMSIPGHWEWSNNGFLFVFDSGQRLDMRSMFADPNTAKLAKAVIGVGIGQLDAGLVSMSSPSQPEAKSSLDQMHETFQQNRQEAERQIAQYQKRVMGAGNVP